MKQVCIIIKGIVQGVFFRAFVERIANELSIKGHVKNRKDGSVEVIAQGTEEQISKLAEACRKGPEGSRVDSVDVEEQDPQILPNFHIER